MIWCFSAAGEAVPPVLVDQSAEYSVTSDWGIEGSHGGRIVGRRVLVKSLVRPVVIEMVDVLVEHSVAVSFVVDQHPVGAFSADAADESFRAAVRPRWPRRSFDDVDTFGGEHGVEGIGERGVPVTDQEAKRADLIIEIHQQVPGGLRGAGRSRISAHPQEMNLSDAHFHDEQDVKTVQPDGVEAEEVGGQKPGGLSAQKRQPRGVCSAWRRTKPASDQDPSNSAGTHAVPESRYGDAPSGAPSSCA